MMLKREEASAKEMCPVKFENLHHRRSQADDEECLKKAWMRENYWEASADAARPELSVSSRMRA